MWEWKGGKLRRCWPGSTSSASPPLWPQPPSPPPPCPASLSAAGQSVPDPSPRCCGPWGHALCAVKPTLTCQHLPAARTCMQSLTTAILSDRELIFNAWSAMMVTSVQNIWSRVMLYAVKPSHTLTLPILTAVCSQTHSHTSTLPISRACRHYLHTLLTSIWHLSPTTRSADCTLVTVT